MQKVIRSICGYRSSRISIPRMIEAARKLRDPSLPPKPFSRPVILGSLASESLIKPKTLFPIILRPKASSPNTELFNHKFSFVNQCKSLAI